MLVVVALLVDVVVGGAVVRLGAGERAGDGATGAAVTTVVVVVAGCGAVC